MSPTFLLAIAGGATAGVGIYLIIGQLLPAPPALGPALRRLVPTTPTVEEHTPIRWLRTRIRIPHTDLAILARSPERYLLTLGLSALFATILPALLTLGVVITDAPISPAIPAGATAAVAVLSVWLAHRDVGVKASTARAEFRRAMCTYLDLAAHQVLSGHGPVESLNRAASICDGWPFERLRAALLRADLQLRPPWDDFKTLAADIDVIELGDLADIMRTAGTEGAHVYQTLRARADSLRDQIRIKALETAEVRTNKLDVPAAALILILLVLIGYPFMIRLFSQ